ncbi:MAG: ATP-binding cassette domain-containing protein [Dehalococcoidales bacterium]|nr:ATP-binding cassette domain-containing protein [Dehalococcoidales bacterium]
MKGTQNKYYIVCEDLFKIYKIAELEVVALRGLDLKVETGELMAIVGASGSGKSTLLNILGGLDVPSAGQVVVGNRDLLKTSSRDLVDYRRQDVGFVWQQTSRNVISYLTAYQNVELPLILLGWSIRKRRRRVEEMMEAVGLTSRSNHFPDRLSGGEQQRVAIAVAMAHNPPLLLADEPTGELDSQTSETVLDVFRSVNDVYGVTVVIVTHDIRIMSKVNRVVTIRDGRTSQETVRKVQTEFVKPEARIEKTHDEFIVVDGAGRLQIPRDLVEKLKLGRRAVVLMEDDHLVVWPVESQEGEEK